jgi:hypothetical protein
MSLRNFLNCSWRKPVGICFSADRRSIRKGSLQWRQADQLPCLYSGLQRLWCALVVLADVSSSRLLFLHFSFLPMLPSSFIYNRFSFIHSFCFLSFAKVLDISSLIYLLYLSSLSLSSFLSLYFSALIALEFPLHPLSLCCSPSV